jgi:hypothetical protein
VTMYNPKTYDILLASIMSARSAAELDMMRGLARIHYAGMMREDLEAAVAKRQSRLSDGETRPATLPHD